MNITEDKYRTFTYLWMSIWSPFLGLPFSGKCIKTGAEFIPSYIYRKTFFRYVYKQSKNLSLQTAHTAKTNQELALEFKTNNTPSQKYFIQSSFANRKNDFTIFVPCVVFNLKYSENEFSE